MGGEAGWLLPALPTSRSGLLPCPRAPSSEHAVSPAPSGVSGSFLARGSSDLEVELLGQGLIPGAQLMPFCVGRPGHLGEFCNIPGLAHSIPGIPGTYPVATNDRCPLGELQGHPPGETPCFTLKPSLLKFEENQVRVQCGARYCGESPVPVPLYSGTLGGGDSGSDGGRGFSADRTGSCGAGRGVSPERGPHPGLRGWGQGPWGMSFEDEVEK